MPDETPHQPHGLDLLGMAREQGEQRARIAALESGHAETRETLREVQIQLSTQDRHLDAQDSKIDRVDAKVAALDTKITAGFDRVALGLDQSLPRAAFVDDLIAAKVARQQRRVHWAAWADAAGAPTQYVLGALTIATGGYALTHPVGRLPDPQVFPFLFPLVGLLLLVIAWGAYRKVHHAPHDAPDQPDDHGTHPPAHP